MANTVKVRKARPGELAMQYGKLPHEDPDIVISRGEGVQKCDGHLLFWMLCNKRPTLNRGSPWEPSLVEELTSRGYDITTLKFSVMKKPIPEIQTIQAKVS